MVSLQLTASRIRWISAVMSYRLWSRIENLAAAVSGLDVAEADLKMAFALFAAA